MENKSVYADKSGIHILLPNGSDYYVGFWQIEKEGYQWWHDHLKDKSWFTEEMSRKFGDLVYEHERLQEV